MSETAEPQTSAPKRAPASAPAFHVFRQESDGRYQLINAFTEPVDTTVGTGLKTKHQEAIEVAIANAKVGTTDSSGEFLVIPSKDAGSYHRKAEVREVATYS